jgi:hypothetical protein
MLLTGCVQQSNTIHTANQVLFDPRLIGEWNTIEGSPKFTFDIRRFPQDDSTYHVIVRDQSAKGMIAEVNARLANIDGKRYLTVAHVDHERHPKFSTIVVDELEPNLKVRVLNPGWLHRAIEADPAIISHQGTAKKQFVITATTEELLGFYQKQLPIDDRWTRFVLARDK